MSNKFNCKKCDHEGTVILRKKDAYCKECFVTNINHKFRASIGKNKILFPNENVLICLSGGLGSITLLELIKSAISLDNHKKLRISPIFFHVIGMGNEDEDLVLAKHIITQCNATGFNIYLTHISEYTQPNKINLIINDIPEVNKNAKLQLESLLTEMHPSSLNDYLNKIKRDIFISCGSKLNCNYIFTAETTFQLAVNLLSNLSLGRGSQVQYDVGFCDSRNDIKIIRPLKDITYEELEKYIEIKELVPIKKQIVQNNSLQSVIQSFVNDLQDNFPSTISTVCKTAEKIGVQDNSNDLKCLFCESALGVGDDRLSALEATNYSRTLSTGQNTNSCLSLEKQSLFPYVDKYFCYSCSKNYCEINKTKVPDHIKEIINRI